MDSEIAFLREIWESRQKLLLEREKAKEEALAKAEMNTVSNK